jgi:hypothetical protein
VFITPDQQVYFFVRNFGKLAKQSLYSNIPIFKATLIHDGAMASLTQNILKKYLQLAYAAWRRQ